MFEEYEDDQEKINKNLASGIYFKGRFRGNPFSRKHAFVSIEGINEDVLLEEMYLQNRALDGDEVIVLLLPVNLWKILPPQKTLVIGNNNKIEERVVDENQEDENLLKIRKLEGNREERIATINKLSKRMRVKG